MASYLSADEAIDRLSERFTITATISDGDAAAASFDLDQQGPFIGTKKVTDGTQTLAFPRSVTPDSVLNVATTAPEAVLDWVALKAYELSTDDEAPVQSEGVERVQVSYFRPKLSRTERLRRPLLEDWRLKSARIV